MTRPYDIIIWGASGFTGRLALDYLYAQHGIDNVKWAVAGRNENKLRQVLAGRDVPILLADANDPESLSQLVKNTRVMLTTVGPYARYGSLLVAACAEYGTHYCDITGEAPWMREMIDLHQETARVSGAKIVHSCGFDSIPSDIGVYYLQQQMLARHGTPAAHIKLRTGRMRGGISGGTLDSILSMIEKATTDRRVLAVAGNPYALNDELRGQDGRDRMTAFWDVDFNAWVGPFLMASVNTRVVRRSNELLGGLYGCDFRYEEGSMTGRGLVGFAAANGLSLGLGAFAGLASMRFTRGLLKRVLPQPGEGPDEESRETGFFEMELLGFRPEDESKNLRVRVRGDRDPGYGSTSKMIAQCALALAQDELPGSGGFWTPASALGEALLRRLPESAGVTFEVQEAS